MDLLNTDEHRGLYEEWDCFLRVRRLHTDDSMPPPAPRPRGRSDPGFGFADTQWEVRVEFISYLRDKVFRHLDETRLEDLCDHAFATIDITQLQRNPPPPEEVFSAFSAMAPVERAQYT